MIYNQDDEDNFLSDKKVGEISNSSNTYRRRGGAYQEEKRQANIVETEEENDGNSTFGKVVLVIAVIVVIIAAIVLFKVFSSGISSGEKEQSSNNTGTETVENNTNTSNNNDKTNNENNSSNDSLAITSTNDTYSAYDVEIESVVYKKGGNFYNNNEKIKGDKVYIEYKQISGLKDSAKQEKINEKLKALAVDLYDKNYLSDENTLFIDVNTKLSVNFNTLSYLVVKTYEDIDGNRKDEKVLSYNIRLSNLEEIDFEDLFTDDASIKNMYSSYQKGKVTSFYFDPKTIYVYDSSMNETKIDMLKNYSSIAIYNRYKDDSNIFTSSATSKKVFTILESTVSEKTTDRAFEQN